MRVRLDWFGRNDHKTGYFRSNGVIVGHRCLEENTVTDLQPFGTHSCLHFHRDTGSDCSAKSERYLSLPIGRLVLSNYDVWRWEDSVWKLSLFESIDAVKLKRERESNIHGEIKMGNQSTRTCRTEMGKCLKGKHLEEEKRRDRLNEEDRTFNWSSFSFSLPSIHRSIRSFVFCRLCTIDYYQ